MKLLLSLSLLAAPAAAQEAPPALAYTHGARLEMEAALDTVAGWIEAARRRDDLDERMCLQPKHDGMTAYAEIAAGAALALREHLAVGDVHAGAMEVRKVGVAAERVRRLHAEAAACLEDTAPELLLVEDPALWRHEADLGSTTIFIIDSGGCGDDAFALASPC